MNTNTMELNLNEMDTVNGGGRGFFTECDSRCSSIFNGAVEGMLIGGVGCSVVGACAAGPLGGLGGALVGIAVGSTVGGIVGGVTYEGDNWT